MPNTRYETYDEVSVEKRKIASFSDEWIDYIRPRVKESTYIKYDNIINNFVMPKFGDIELMQLTGKEIEKLS